MHINGDDDDNEMYTKALDSVMRNIRTQGDRGRGHIEKPHDEQREEKGRI
jgi:hypothetical protein